MRRAFRVPVPCDRHLRLHDGLALRFHFLMHRLEARRAGTDPTVRHRPRLRYRAI